MKACPVCGTWLRKGERHDHHPALEENFPDFVCPVCHRCHNGFGSLTDRQYRRGMIRARGTDQPSGARSEAEKDWCLAQGTLDVFIAACEHADPATPLAPLGEDTGKAILRLLWLSSPSDFGPEIAKNIRRTVRRRKDPLFRPARPRIAGALTLLLLVRDFSATAGERIAGGSAPQAQVLAARQSEVTFLLNRLVTDPRTPFVALVKLWRAGALARIIDRALGILDLAREPVRRVATAADTEEAGEALMRVARIAAPLERATIDFLHTLCLGEDPTGAANRYMEALWEIQPGCR